MTIDERINKEKQEANRDRRYQKDCENGESIYENALFYKERADESEQLIEWLEELKTLRKFKENQSKIEKSNNSNQDTNKREITDEIAIAAIQNDLEWHSKELKPKYKRVLEYAIQAIKERKAYQDIGSVEDFRELKNRDFEIGD